MFSRHGETMEALNRSFVDSVKDRVTKDASCDLSQLANDYCVRAKELTSPAAAANGAKGHCLIYSTIIVTRYSS